MKSKTSIIFMLLGAVLILSACALGMYFVYEDYQSKESAALVLAMVEQDVKQAAEQAGYAPEQDNTSSSDTAEDATAFKSFDENEYGVIGVLTLETLDIRLPVLGEYSMEDLKTTVCRYEGDYFTQNGKMVIAGHNYKSHFGKLSQMAAGDAVSFTNIYGEEYQYYVKEIIEIDGSDTDALEDGEWTLSLFTCSFDRTKRIVVRCHDA